MNEIKYPALCVDGYSLEIWKNCDTEITCTLLSYVKGSLKGIIIYDVDGQVFKSIEAVPNRKISIIGRILCYIAWNPSIKVKLEFEKTKRKPNLEKLKAKIRHIIRIDDDAYTQFMEQDEIFKIVNNAKTIKELILGVQGVLETGY